MLSLALATAVCISNSSSAGFCRSRSASLTAASCSVLGNNAEVCLPGQYGLCRIDHVIRRFQKLDFQGGVMPGMLELVFPLDPIPEDQVQEKSGRRSEPPEGRSQ